MKNILKKYFEELEKSQDKNKDIALGFTFDNIMNTLAKSKCSLDAMQLVEFANILRELRETDCLELKTINEKKVFFIKDWQRIKSYYDS